MAALSTAAAAAAIAALWLQQDPGSRTTDATHELRRRAEALDGREQRDCAQHAALLLSARTVAGNPATDPGELLPLLRSLALFTVHRSFVGDDVQAPATTLIACYRDARRLHPAAVWQLADHRRWAEVCLLANDLGTLADVLRRALPASPAANPFELACIQIVACQMECRLGRPESAARAAADAKAAADRYTDSLPPDQRQRAERLQLAVALATADVCLLADDLAGAMAALAPLPAGPEVEFRRHLFEVMGGDRTNEAKLYAAATGRQIERGLRTLALAKLVQSALGNGDLAAARARLDRLLAIAPVATGQDEGRSAAFALEVALRDEALDTVLLADARIAYGRVLDDWRRAPAVAGGTGLLWIGDRATLVASLVRAEAAAAPGPVGARAALQQLLRAHRALGHDLQEPDVDAVLAELLAPHRGLLVYAPGRFGSVVLCCDAGGVQARALAPAKQLRHLADRLREAALDALQTPGAAELEALQAAAAAAADAVLPTAVRDRLQTWRGVTISGAGMLQNLPFELLPLPTDAGPRHLGTQVAIDYLANLVAGAVAPPRRPLTSAVVFAGSLSTSAHGSGPLLLPPATAQLADPYRAHGLAPTTWLDEALHVDQLRAALPKASVVHLFGHGEFDYTHTYEHGIRFDDSAEGLLTGDAVVGLDLRGLVVIFGSCGAGEAPWRRGGEPLAASLAGAFQAAGARAVIVPTTDLQLGRHLLASRPLHTALADDVSPAMAMLAARQAQAAVGDTAALLELLLMQVQGRGF